MNLQNIYLAKSLIVIERSSYLFANHPPPQPSTTTTTKRRDSILDIKSMIPNQPRCQLFVSLERVCRSPQTDSSPSSSSSSSLIVVCFLEQMMEKQVDIDSRQCKKKKTTPHTHTRMPTHTHTGPTIS